MLYIPFIICGKSSKRVWFYEGYCSGANGSVISPNVLVNDLAFNVNCPKESSRLVILW